MIQTDTLTCRCGVRYFLRPDGIALCRKCAAIHAPWYTCERCDRDTQTPLTMRDGELVCRHCLTRDPDPTPEEIALACAEIRREWSPGEAYQRLIGIVEETD